MERNCRTRHFSSGETIIEAGATIVFVPLVLSGSIRVLRENKNDGREVFLYHIMPSQTCAMALNCCQSAGKSSIKAVADGDTEVLMIPANMVEEWYNYSEWKAFIHATYATRYAELLQVIDLIAFSNMDKQLLNYLQKRVEVAHTPTLRITHQQIADELHTQREAISRLLRQMEQKGLVRLGRNEIELIT
ncbi:MAG TPA: Crp/Fnr family transcriptional regulator [Chitinophagales bacterium]|nr:Crp/Fnr family transcriptional regulator [Chitinophagales bacterium]